ncbi:MAG: hypothetical protein WCP85_04390 [Mariniphaga sp.]
MLKSKLIRFTNIALAGWLVFYLANCTKDDNTFLPYVKISLYISLVNQNHLKIPGNSIMFINHGVKGVIVSCVNPDLGQYGAFDACCPNEKDYSGVVELEPVKNLTTPPGMVYSSGFFGKCNKCGSVFNLMGNGQPVSGPATHYLQSYHITTGFETLTVIN